MAEKKKAASSKKKSVAAPKQFRAASPKPSYVKPEAPKYNYDELYAGRKKMNEAQADVLQAELEVNSAYANQGDFAARDVNHAAAMGRLNEARSRATAAVTEFQILKLEMKGRKK